MSSKIETEKVCQHCGETFTAYTTKTRYCSHRCASLAYKARKRSEKIKTATGRTRKEQTKTITEIQSKELLTASEAAFFVGCSMRTIYRLISTGKLKAYNPGQRLTRIEKESVLNMLRAFEVETKPEKETSTPKPITEFYTIKEVEKFFNIKYSRLNQIIKKANVPTKILSNKLYISKTHLDRYMKKTRPDYSNISEWYTVPELMDKYNLTRDQVYGRVSDNNIPKKREGKFVKISKQHFDERFQLKINL